MRWVVSEKKQLGYTWVIYGVCTQNNIVHLSSVLEASIPNNLLLSWDIQAKKKEQNLEGIPIKTKKTGLPNH